MTLPFLGVIAREGIETVDGRIIGHGALTWDAPILLLDLTRDPLGDLTRVWRDNDGTVRAEGVTTLPPGTYPVGVEVDSCRFDHPRGTNTVTFTNARLRRLVVYRGRAAEPAWPDARITVADPDLLNLGIVRDSADSPFTHVPPDPPAPPRGPAAATPAAATPDDDTTQGGPMPQLLGRPVWFRSRTGRWTAPAFVTATTRSLYRPNVDAGHLRPLTSDRHVHLIVLTAGLQGHVSDETRETHPELADPDRPNLPAGGTFQEFDVPEWQPEGAWQEGQFRFEEQPPGTWMWPL